MVREAIKYIIRHLPGALIFAFLTSLFNPDQYRVSDRLPIWIAIFVLCLVSLIVIRTVAAFVRVLIEE